MPYAHPSGFPPRSPPSSYVFRSFRSLMSIAARVVPFSRSFRSLIKWQRGEPLHIKVLQTLGCSVVQAAIDIKVLQTLGMARETRSPARMASEGPKRFSCHDSTMASVIPARMASEGPRPTMKGRRYFYRSAGACPPRSLDHADDSEGNPAGVGPTSVVRERPLPNGSRSGDLDLQG